MDYSNFLTLLTPNVINYSPLLITLLCFLLATKSPASRRTSIITLLFVCELVTCLSIYLTPQLFPSVKLINYSPDQIPIAGTGSMYPTFPKSDQPDNPNNIVAYAPMYPYPRQVSINSQTYSQSELKRGDIITFSNQSTQEITSQQDNGTPHGFAKRLIGLPGDTIQLRDGLVYLNDKTLLEPYVSQARSTFGGQFLPECQNITIPDSQIFVMGDNRKGSLDSRDELGLVNITDIDHFLPFEQQLPLYSQLWRDTKNDTSESSRIQLSTSSFIEEINNNRTQTSPLKNNSQLNQIALLRAQSIIKFNDLSFEATSSGQSQEYFINRNQFQATQWGEIIYQGYYTAEELIERLSQSQNNQEFFYSPDFSQIGIGITQGNLNDCPTQIIVIHLTGYIPPNYTPEVINSWNSGLEDMLSLRTKIEPMLQNPDQYADFNQEIAKKYLEIVKERIRRLELIVSRLKSNQYLTPQEQDFMKQDEDLVSQLDDLAKQI